MPEIPSDLPASAAQIGVQAREVAKERESPRLHHAHGATRQLNATDEAGSMVETADADVAVFAEAEGSGSQGRQLNGTVEDGPTSPTQNASDGVTRGQDGQLHIDLKA